MSALGRKQTLAVELGLLAPQPHQRLIQRLQEPRAIRLLKRLWPAGDAVRRYPQVCHDRPRRDRSADAGGGEGLAVVADDGRALLQAAVGEEDVAGDDHRPRIRLLDDPVVGRVELVADHHPINQHMIRHAHPHIADHADRHLAPPGDLVDLVLDGTGVGVDQDAHRECYRG